MSAKFCRQCGVPLLDVTDDGLCANCRQLQEKPDALSKRTELAGVPFKDLKHLDEDDRVELLVKLLSENPPKAIGFMVDTGPAYQGKGDRIIEKVRRILPDVKIVSRRNGPTRGAETIVFKQSLF